MDWFSLASGLMTNVITIPLAHRYGEGKSRREQQRQEAIAQACWFTLNKHPHFSASGNRTTVGIPLYNVGREVTIKPRLRNNRMRWSIGVGEELTLARHGFCELLIPADEDLVKVFEDTASEWAFEAFDAAFERPLFRSFAIAQIIIDLLLVAREIPPDIFGFEPNFVKALKRYETNKKWEMIWRPELPCE
jgi:hypothetical protein